MDDIIKIERSIIPACDVGKDKYEEIIRKTHNIPQVGAYKIGAALGLSVGLPTLVEIARKYTDKPLIYDHQKAGTDIPDTAKDFVATLKKCGIAAVILFPLAGPATQTAWIQSAHQEGLPIIVGGMMTHDSFCVSDGGYIDNAAINTIYSNAASFGVSDYVVPGNKPEIIQEIRNLLLASKVEPIFYAPGFITQGGTISKAASVAGPRWHAIVGRAVYEAYDIRRTTLSLANCL